MNQLDLFIETWPKTYACLDHNGNIKSSCCSGCHNVDIGVVVYPSSTFTCCGQNGSMFYDIVNISSGKMIIPYKNIGV